MVDLFFPGTMESDAHLQLLMFLGGEKLTGHFPVFVTQLMGGCLLLGRMVFGSDSIGIFIYTLAQFGVQSMIFAYTIYVLCRIKAPVLLRWGALVFYGIYPLFPLWGYIFGKDTGYYLFVLLFVTTLVYMLYEGKAWPKWWMILLFAVSAMGMGIFRNDGRWVVLISLICCMLAWKKYWRVFLIGMAVCLISVFTMEGIYMRAEEIPRGSVREMLSIPLQQTARYVREHYEEITPEEKEVLQNSFSVDLDKLAELYEPDLSDPVKAAFMVYPDGEELGAYFGVWWQQLLKHPDTYIQAFLNHIYGYFYPEKDDIWGDIGVFTFEVNPRYVNAWFGVQGSGGRQLLEGCTRLIRRIPVIGMLYSVGMHSYFLLGCMVYLLSKKRYRDLALFAPGLCVLLICMVSPVNACLRYMLPVMVLLPVHLAYVLTPKEMTD